MNRTSFLFGYEGIKEDHPRNNGTPTEGRFSFDTVWTRWPNVNSPAAPAGFGQSVAALLVGVADERWHLASGIEF